MIVEIVTTGTELLLGQIINTNAPYLAQRLNELGFNVLFQSTVGDNRERMAQVLTTALSRADIVITSGGLGPTQGDITKEVTAGLLNLPMHVHEPSVRRIELFFEKRAAIMPSNNLRQAMMAKGAIVLDNDRGTAPGAILETGDKTIIHLPGPPYELEGMFEAAVVPYLQQRFGLQGIILSRVLKTFEIGESSLEDEIKDLIIAQTNPTIALLAQSSEVLIRITAKGESKEAALASIDSIERKIRERLGDKIFAVDEETMESVVGKMLTAKQLTIACAESCTGGLLTSRITDVPGSSDYLLGSVVCYSNEIKVAAVKVGADILAEHGAVSEETAKAMCKGIRQQFNTDIGLGTTGIAGPGGATTEKPVGLVYIAVDGPAGTKCYKNEFSGSREKIKYRTTQTALNILRKYIGTL
ncbi:MAG: competence/damage-inducible protein A [Pelosinus sp.]|nr:competence/damage-inducible protein A [Pelosinus sp.]